MSNSDEAETGHAPRDPYRAQRWLDTVTANVASGLVLYVLGALAGVFPHSVDSWVLTLGLVGLPTFFLVVWWALRRVSQGRQFSRREQQVGTVVLYGAAVATFVFIAYATFR